MAYINMSDCVDRARARAALDRGAPDDATRTHDRSDTIYTPYSSSTARFAAPTTDFKHTSNAHERSMQDLQTLTFSA
eukprot:SAG31_NODE_21_length_34109_cov_60.598824_15_plen_77_part_00